jgi:hypothetical protein
VESKAPQEQALLIDKFQSAPHDGHLMVFSDSFSGVANSSIAEIASEICTYLCSTNDPCLIDTASEVIYFSSISLALCSGVGLLILIEVLLDQHRPIFHPSSFL